MEHKKEEDLHLSLTSTSTQQHHDDASPIQPHVQITSPYRAPAHPQPNLPKPQASATSITSTSSPTHPLFPTQCLPNITRVYLFLDMLLLHTDASKLLFDKSLTPLLYRELTAEYQVSLVCTSANKIEEYSKVICKELELPSVEITERQVKDLIEESKKQKIKIIISDELLAKQKAQDKSEVLSGGYCIVFMSLFTNNEYFPNLDFTKIESGRGCGSIASKLKYSHIKDRIRVGLFIENVWYKPSTVNLFWDTDKIEFVPLSFMECPITPVDFVFSRANTYKVLGNEMGDPIGKKIFENYMKYEEKCKKAVFIDRFDAGKLTIYRSEFMEELREQSDIENNRLQKKLFEIPWTRGGDYLDLLKKPSTDPAIANMLGSIPYPLITKSDLACVDSASHSFMIIKEKPQNWDELKTKILHEYGGRQFIVQSYFMDKKNLVVKAITLFGHFSYDIRGGLNDAVSGADSTTGSFVTQPAKGEKDLPETSVSPQMIEEIKSFQLNLAKRLRLHLIGVDYLIDSERQKILPIDLNKLPRFENIPNFRQILDANFLKSREESPATSG